MGHKKRQDFIHHQKQSVSTAVIREAIFGMEDGMVSTFGTITGIAAATQDPFIVILAGSVIIGVESISMGVGSFLSSKSEKEIEERKLHEEKIELAEEPLAEKKELEQMFISDGWPTPLSKQMAEAASKNKDLFLKEMAYRELKVFPDRMESPAKNAAAMLCFYVFGGVIPLLPYVIFPVGTAIPISIAASIFGLFALGTFTTKYTKKIWWKAGSEMLALGGIAAGVGYYIGQLVDMMMKR